MLYEINVRGVVPLLGLLILTIFFVGCEKDEPPYEYPEDPGQLDPILITHFQRDLSSAENWSITNTEENCKGSLTTINYAFYDIDTSRGFATMHLIPDSTSCELQVSMRSEIDADEVTNVSWSDLEYEFTFSELLLNSQTELWLGLNYKELEMMVDFAPLILSVDSTIDNGVIKVFQDEDGVKFQVNGSKVNPDFNIDGNFLSTEGSGDEQFVSLDLIASDTDEQSLLVFQFLRITSFTVPEP